MLQAILNALFLLLPQANHQIVVTYLESITYPQVARDAQIQGTVEIEVKVSPQGDVVSTSTGPAHPMLKRAAEENIGRWKFAPGTARTFTITYEFSLEEPRTEYRSETRNYYYLPSRVRVLTTLPARTD